MWGKDTDRRTTTTNAANAVLVFIDLHNIVEYCGLHEEGVVSLFDSLDALFVVLDEDGGLRALHVLPHLQSPKLLFHHRPKLVM